MDVNNDKLEALAIYMDENPKRAEYLVTLPAEEAVAKINEDGFNFSCDELRVYARELDKLLPNQNGELDEESLENITGGGVAQWLLRVLCPPPYIGTWEQMRRKGRGW